MPEISISPALTLYYEDRNSSSPRSALLIHGLGATSESWALQIPDLIGAGFRVITPDARGFGKSTYPGGRHTIADMAVDLHKLMAALGIPKYDVIGISMGGTIALQMAIAFPENLNKLVLVNTFARLRFIRITNLWYLAYRMVRLYTSGLSAQAHLVSEQLFPLEEQEMYRTILYDQIMQSNPAGYRNTIMALARFNVSKDLRNLNLPTLVISGRDDNTVPLEVQKQMVERIPGSKHIIINSAGHAVTVEKPGEFNQCLLSFLLDEDE